MLYTTIQTMRVILIIGGVCCQLSQWGATDPIHLHSTDPATPTERWAVASLGTFVPSMLLLMYWQLTGDVVALGLFVVFIVLSIAAFGMLVYGRIKVIWDGDRSPTANDATCGLLAGVVVCAGVAGLVLEFTSASASTSPSYATASVTATATATATMGGGSHVPYFEPTQWTPQALATWTYLQVAFTILVTALPLQVARHALQRTVALMETRQAFVRYISHEIRYEREKKGEREEKGE
jgi:hypothetical protein